MIRYSKMLSLFSSDEIFLVIEVQEVANSDGFSFNDKLVLYFNSFLLSGSLVILDSHILPLDFLQIMGQFNFFGFFVF